MRDTMGPQRPGKKKPCTQCTVFYKSGRGERIRTSGLYVPNVALYQAKLHPDLDSSDFAVFFKTAASSSKNITITTFLRKWNTLAKKFFETGESHRVERASLQQWRRRTQCVYDCRDVEYEHSASRLSL
ncbi:hypothetical protein EMIT0111MI5_60388 [Burkholderia sp. IT-111MI5]